MSPATRTSHMPRPAVLVLAALVALVVIGALAIALTRPGAPLPLVAPAAPAAQQRVVQVPSDRSARGSVAYQGGPVQLHPTSYLIFWGPSWQDDFGALNAVGQDVENYFADMGGTPYENILTQYCDAQRRCVANTHELDGVWIDTSRPKPDPGCIGAHTISDTNIQREIQRAIQQAGWPTDSENAVYFLYIEKGYDVGAGGVYQGMLPGLCAPNSLYEFCGYHDYSNLAHVAYAVFPYPTDPKGCAKITSDRDTVSQVLIKVSAHEQFEAISDPRPQTNTAFNSDNGGEVGDKCNTQFPPQETVLHGNPYNLQLEYSNADRACVNQR